MQKLALSLSKVPSLCFTALDGHVGLNCFLNMYGKLPHLHKARCCNPKALGLHIMIRFEYSQRNLYDLVTGLLSLSHSLQKVALSHSLQKIALLCHTYQVTCRQDTSVAFGSSAQEYAWIYSTILRYMILHTISPVAAAACGCRKVRHAACLTCLIKSRTGSKKADWASKLLPDPFPVKCARPRIQSDRLGPAVASGHCS